MHFHMEIVMPQVDNVEEAVKTVMAPFNEQPDADEEDARNPFWDFWVVGGRWAGAKLEALLDQDKMKEFQEELKRRNVTVSGIQCGKQELSPASQIPMVDKLWEEYFPQYTGRACPLFNHSNDQYSNDCLHGDVMPLRDVPRILSSERVMFVAPNYDGSSLEATAMFSQSIWNGVNYEDTAWDGTFGAAVDLFAEKSKNYGDTWKERATPADDWLVVTVDYHS